MIALQPSPDGLHPSPEDITQLECQVRRHLGNRIRHLRIFWHQDGWLLEGQTATYHAKQLVQEAVMDTTPLPIHTNRIEVLSRTLRVF